MSGQWTLMICMICWIGYVCMTRLQKTRIGHGHAYLSIWLLCCLPTPFYINNFWLKLQLELISRTDEIYRLLEIKDRNDEVRRRINELIRQYNSLYYNEYIDYTKNELSTWEILNQLSKLISVWLFWLFVMRFKRVQVQIVQDEGETTAMIFKKLKYSSNYQYSFVSPLLLF